MISNRKLLTLRPYLAQPIRVEEYAEDSRYLVKAEHYRRKGTRGSGLAPK